MRAAVLQPGTMSRAGSGAADSWMADSRNPQRKTGACSASSRYLLFRGSATRALHSPRSDFSLALWLVQIVPLIVPDAGSGPMAHRDGADESVAARVSVVCHSHTRKRCLRSMVRRLSQASDAEESPAHRAYGCVRPPTARARARGVVAVIAAGARRLTSGLESLTQEVGRAAGGMKSPGGICPPPSR